MASNSITLSDLLRTNNPRVNDALCRRGRNTNSTKKTWKQPHFIEDWLDFDCEAMQLIYGGLLQEVLTKKKNFKSIRHPPTHAEVMISDESSFQGQVLLQWNYPVVSEALSESQDHLSGKVLRRNVSMALGSEATLPGHDAKLKPDWAGIQRKATDTFNSTKPINILPGETKVSKKWSSSDIEKGEVTTTYHISDWLRPIAQIFTYCVQSGNRYGYIISDKELLAVRIRPALQDVEEASAFNPESRQSSKPIKNSPTTCALRAGMMECKSIPWHFSKDENPNQLTVNQAIWYLHMLAAENREIEHHYQPLRREICRRKYTRSETVILQTGATRKRRRDETAATSISSNAGVASKKRCTPTSSRQSTQNLSFVST